MAVKRNYAPVSVDITDGGRLLPDLPPHRIGSSDFVESVNWRREDGCDIKREGWDYPAPLPSWDGDGLGDFNAGLPAEAIMGVRRPNGTYAIVGAGYGYIKAFNYDTNSWETIGSGFSLQGDTNFRWWQIVDMAGYAVFNNARDLPVWWQVGDASVTPIYEMREQGYASVGNIVEYNGVLMCSDILEIDPTSLSAVMNSGSPYGVVVDGASPLTTRIAFQRIWSNIGDPRDFAAVVAGDITTGTNSLVTLWPMASFQIGDLITVLGAGVAGGNLTSTITNRVGVTVTLLDNASTTVVAGEVSRSTAITSIVGSDELEGDGSAIIIEIVLKNQLVSFKASGEIHQTAYVGDIENPFSAERVSKTKRAVRFPRAAINVRDEYILFPGDRHFYTFPLSAQEPSPSPYFMGAETSLFFERIEGTDQYAIFAADNAPTGEIFVFYGFDAGDEYEAKRILALNYNETDECLKEIDDAGFTCAATVRKPLADWQADPTESWFLMGDEAGRITLYGKSNIQVFTQRRYGEVFWSSMAGGLMGFGSDEAEKYLKRFTILLKNPVSSDAMVLYLYGTRQTNVAPTLLTTKTLTNPVLPGVANVYFRKAYFQYRFRTNADLAVSISGWSWLVSGADTGQVESLAAGE